MMAGDFQRKLRKLNKELRIFCGDNPNSPAGIFHVVAGEYDHICGAPKNWVAERSWGNVDGTIAHSGWRRILRILIAQGLIDRRNAEKVFCTHLPYAVEPIKWPTPEKSRKLIEQYGWDQDRLRYEIRRRIGRSFTEQEFQGWIRDYDRRFYGHR